MSRPWVDLSVTPHLAVLAAWGRPPSGSWWGLVVWEQHMRRGLTPARLRCSGWVAADTMRRRDERQPYGRLPRVQLDEDPAWWPAPPGGWGVHYGVLTGQPLYPPDGWNWCAAPTRARTAPLYEPMRPSGPATGR